MKRLPLPTSPTSRGRSRRSRPGTAGGLTLETALVMPIFLLLIFFLLFIVKSAAIAMALHNAMSQTAAQSAAAWYPISLGLEQARSSELQRQSASLNEGWLKVGEAMKRYGRWLPSPLNEWAEQAAGGSLSLEENAAKAAFGGLIRQYAAGRVLDTARIKLDHVVLPDADKVDEAFLTLEAGYELPFRVPFTGRKLVLRDSVRERAWIGGSPSKSLLADGEEEPFTVEFISLEPDPARVGRKAKLTIRTAPGTVFDLSILYKSGLSRAKHLGSATADGNGIVAWTWLVSGNTTPGMWSFIVTGAGGGSWQHSFEVAGKAAAGEGGA